MALNKVTLTGTYLDGTGTPLAGYLKFVPNTELTDATDSEIVRQSPITVTLTTEGTFSVELYATDNAHLLPSGWVWNCTEYITGLPANAFSFELAYATASTQDISSLTTITDAPETSQYVPSSEVGQPSGVAALNSGGYVPITQGGTGAGSASAALTALGAIQIAGDLGGTAASPQVTGTHLAAALPVAQGGTGSTTRNFGALLIPTAVKTANYTAASGDMVKTDTSGGSFTVTLPTAPPVNTTIGVKQVTVAGLGTNATTIATGGSDVFNKSGGSTSLILDRLNQTVVLQYGSGADWTVISADDATGQIATARQGVYYLDSYTGTDDQKMTSALTALFAAGGGTIVLSPRAHTFANQWTTTYSAGVATAVKIQGAGVAFNGAWGTPAAATTATFTYSSSGAACIDMQHIGTIEITGCKIANANTGIPLFQTTNATPNLHDNIWSGGGSGVTCTTDAVVLGGTTTAVGAGDTAKYNAYQGQVYRNLFDGVRRQVRCNNAANSVQIFQNTSSTSCGSNLPWGAAYDLIASGRGISGVAVYGNCIEMSSYPVGVKCTGDGTNAVTASTFGPNGFFDSTTATTITCYYFDAKSSGSQVADGYHSTNSPFVMDFSGSNVITQAAEGAGLWSVQPSDQLFSNYNGSTPAAKFVGVSTTVPGSVNVYQGGDQAGWLIQTSTYPDPVANVYAASCTQVSDGIAYTGSYYIVSASAAAFTSADVGAPILQSGTGPSRNIISAVFGPATAPYWFASNAYSLGDIARPPTSNSHLYQCTTAGTSGSSAPTWPTSGGTVTDGTAVWTDLGTSATAVLATRAGLQTASSLTLSFGRVGTSYVMTGFSRHHIISTGSAPSWTLGNSAQVGAGATITVTAGGGDLSQEINLTTGTGSLAAGLLATGVPNINFGSRAPKCWLMPKNSASAALFAGGMWLTSTTAQWTVNCAGTPAASTAYVFDILSME